MASSAEGAPPPLALAAPAAAAPSDASDVAAASPRSPRSSPRTGSPRPGDGSGRLRSPLTLPVKVSLSALAQKLLLQRDLQPRANGLGVEHPLRALAIAVCTTQAFDSACMLVILANCMLLSIYDPLDKAVIIAEMGPRNRAAALAEDYFQALFTLEMVLKVVAYGWLGRGPSGAWVGYLADPWSWLDGIIVLVGFVFYSPAIEGSTSTISALRTIRVMRPLKNLNSMPSMRLVVKSVLAALPSLANVIILLLFSLLLVAIVGLMLWPGVLAGQCAYLDPVSGGSVLTGAFAPCRATRRTRSPARPRAATSAAPRSCASTSSRSCWRRTPRSTMPP